jgi:opacity protein-like surface antigen
MRKIFLLFLFLMTIRATAEAQVVPPDSNDGVHIELGLTYTLLTNSANADGSTQMNSVTGLRARLPLTDRWSAVYMQLVIPSANSNVYLAGPEYRRLLSDLIKSSSAKLDLRKIQVYIAAGIGTRRDSNGNSPSFAYGAGGGFSYSISPNVAMGVEFGFLHAPIIHQHFMIANTPTIAPGIQFRF